MIKFKVDPLAWAIPCGILLFAWMTLFNIRPIADPDIWWHLGSGRYMVEHDLVPKTDVFSLTAQGSSWVDTYWLQEIGIYLLFRAGGIPALILVNSMLIAAFVCLIGFVNPERYLSWTSRVWGVLWIFLAGHPRGFGWEEKASIVTFGFLGLLFYTLRIKDWTSQSRWIRIWPLLFLLWANMHRGFILGLGILGLYVLDEAMRKSSNWIRLGLWWAVCAAATLVNPWGTGVYGMGWQDLSLSPSFVRGWAQTPFYHLELFWLSLVVFWGIVGWKLWKRQRLGIGFLLTSVVLSGFSIRYASLYRYFVIWAVPWLLPTFSGQTRHVESLKWALGAGAVILIVSLNLKPAFGINKRIFPVEAVDFMKTQNLRMPFFHDYEFGGYYLWAFDGRPPVLIDGRYPAVQGYQHLSTGMHHAIESSPENFHRFLHPLNLHAAVVKYPSTQFNPSPFSLYFPRKEWALIYWDDVVLIFLQRTPEFRQIINKYEYRHVQPDSDRAYWLKTVWLKATPSEKEEIREEFTRNFKAHPGNSKPRIWLTLLE